MFLHKLIHAQYWNSLLIDNIQSMQWYWILCILSQPRFCQYKSIVTIVRGQILCWVRQCENKRKQSHVLRIIDLGHICTKSFGWAAPLVGTLMLTQQNICWYVHILYLQCLMLFILVCDISAATNISIFSAQPFIVWFFS